MVHGEVEPSAATVVLNHHQQYDGSGYSGEGNAALDGQQIHVLARIVALTDQFDRTRHLIDGPSEAASEPDQSSGD